MRRRTVAMGGLALALASCPGPEPSPADGGSGSSTSPADSTGQQATGSSGDPGLDSSGEETSSSSGGAPLPSGELVVLTYNVAGLPQGLSSSDPENNIPQMSPLLNAFQMVLVQEDFWYHAELSAEVTLPYASMPWSRMPTLDDIGDGLNRFGEHPFVEHERVAWYACNGTIDCASDCLATKGWSFARHTLAEGVELDVYNLHNEAGSCPEDIEIRLNAAQDLVEGIQARSEGRAVLVAGDFNLDFDDPEDVEPLNIILDGAGLTDACTAVGCGDERIDKVMVRGHDQLGIEVLDWWVPPEFVDANTGEPLSDHLPVAVQIAYGPPS